MQSGLGALALLCALWCATHLFGWSVAVDGTGPDLRACLVGTAHARAVPCLTRTCGASVRRAAPPSLDAVFPMRAMPLCPARPRA